MKNTNNFPIVANGHARGKHHMLPLQGNVCRNAWYKPILLFSVNLTVFSCAPCRRRGKLFSEIVCQSFYFVAIVTILNGVLCVNDIKTPSSDTKMNSQNKGEPKVETEQKDSSNTNKCIDDFDAVLTRQQSFETLGSIPRYDEMFISNGSTTRTRSMAWRSRYPWSLSEYHIHILYNPSVYY